MVVRFYSEQAEFKEAMRMLDWLCSPARYGDSLSPRNLTFAAGVSKYAADHGFISENQFNAVGKLYRYIQYIEGKERRKHDTGVERGGRWSSRRRNNKPAGDKDCYLVLPGVE